MESLIRLWPSLESSPALLEVTEEWQRRLASEYAPLRRFLVATDTIAGGYPGRHGCRRYRVVVHSPSDICGIDDDSGEQIELTLADVTCYRFNVRALAGEICAALGFRPAFGPVPEMVHTWRLGTLPMQLGACPVYLSLRAAPEDLCAAVLAIAAEARRPFLLLTGSRHSEGGPLTAVLQLTGGQVAPAAELVGLGAGGRIVAAPDSLRSLAMLLGVAAADAPPGCVFRLEGEYRTVAFDGATIHLKESAGLWYIGRLLASPNRDLPAAQLEADRTGVSAIASTGSVGEAIDPEAKAAYKQRLDELDREIEEATRHHDHGRCERLQQERLQLIDALRSAAGLHGRTRVKTDVDRARKAVSQAVARDITRIAEHHPSLGRHLRGAISSGTVLRYSPEREYDWQL